MDKLPSRIDDFCIWPRYTEKLDTLASLADTEDWAYPEKTITINATQHPVLSNYIKYTYSRLAEPAENKILIENDVACFNTGLFTSLYESIYAFFGKNKHYEENNKNPKWFLVGFFQRIKSPT
jgi:hypothetical protein